MTWNFKERKKKSMLRFNGKRRALKESFKGKELVEAEKRNWKILKHTIHF